MRYIIEIETDVPDAFDYVLESAKISMREVNEGTDAGGFVCPSDSAATLVAHRLEAV